MKALLIILLLAGCKSTPPIENISGNAKQDIEMIYTVLSKECKTETVQLAKNNAQARIDSIVEYCNLEKDNLQKEIRYRNLIIFVLAGLVLLTIARKVLKFLRVIG